MGETDYVVDDDALARADRPCKQGADVLIEITGDPVGQCRCTIVDVRKAIWFLASSPIACTVLAWRMQYATPATDTLWAGQNAVRHDRSRRSR
jgi:hypothetical protein